MKPQKPYKYQLFNPSVADCKLPLSNMLAYVDFHHLHALHGIGKRDPAYTAPGSMAHLICPNTLLALAHDQRHSFGLLTYTNGPNASGPTGPHMAYSCQIFLNGANDVNF